VSTFPNQLQNRAAATIAQTRKLVQNAHQRLNTVVSQVTALTPGSWELVTLQHGWSNVPGYIPAQVRILQNGMSQLVGHIEGGTTTDGTVIGTLTAGFFNAVHAHSFTANVLAGASAVSVQGAISGQTDTNGLSNAFTTGNSASASGSGAHTHGPGSYEVSGPGHVHTNVGGSFVPATSINYNTVTLTLDTSGNLTLTNCSPAAQQLSFSELLPLVTA